MDRFELAGVSSETARHAQWSGTASVPPSLIVLPCEYKRADEATNRNRLIMDLGTAQSHRRAVGLKDCVIFGIASATDRVTVLSSWWNKDIVNYIKHPVWEPIQPDIFIKFYMFLCNLGKHMHDSMKASAEEIELGQALVLRWLRLRPAPQ